MRKLFKRKCYPSCLLEKREGIYSDKTRWVTKKIKRWHIISYSHPFTPECYRRRLCRISQSWKMLKKMIGRTKQKLLTRVQGDCSRVKMGKRLWFWILWMFEPLNTVLGKDYMRQDLVEEWRQTVPHEAWLDILLNFSKIFVSSMAQE